MTKRIAKLLNVLGAATLALSAYGEHKPPTGQIALSDESNLIQGQRKTRGPETPVIVDVTLNKAGELASAVEGDLMDTDSLIVRGPVNDEDFRIMWEAGRYGKLKGINLEFALPIDKTIPDYAFYHRQYQAGTGIIPVYIDYITLPPDIEHIGKEAFHLVAIKELKLPPSLKTIGDEAFAGCRWIKTECLEIPEGTEYIPYCCFRECYEIESFSLPSSVKELKPLAFYNTRMTSINLPDGLEQIGEQAFLLSSELMELTIPESCLSIGEKAFGACASLRILNLPSTLESLPQRMAENSVAIEEMILPPTVREIGDRAFADCWGLKRITFPDGLEYIGVDAFRNCHQLEELRLPSTLKSIQSGAAAGCESLKRMFCAAAIPPQALCDNGDPTMTPFGYYEHITGQINTDRNSPLFVPIGSGEKYRLSAGWDYFTDIRETDDFSASVETSTLSDPLAGNTATYDLTGRKMRQPVAGQIYIKGGRKHIAD